MRIYTRTGDDGTTGLLGGSRVAKESARIEAIGEVDELNCAIGLARSVSPMFSRDRELERTQSRLFDLGAELASPPEGRIRVEALSDADVAALECSIDLQTSELPPLANFILPGGSPLAANLHFARAVCRRAERSVLRLHVKEPVRAVILGYLNRLSDWLFVTARTANRESDVQDIAWRRSEEIESC